MKLTCVEALAATLFITGFPEECAIILSKFTWGLNFLEVNRDLLDAYAACTDSIDIVQTQNRLLLLHYAAKGVCSVSFHVSQSCSIFMTFCFCGILPRCLASFGAHAGVKAKVDDGLDDEEEDIDDGGNCNNVAPAVPVKAVAAARPQPSETAGKLKVALAGLD